MPTVYDRTVAMHALAAGRIPNLCTIQRMPAAMERLIWDFELSICTVVPRLEERGPLSRRYSMPPRREDHSGKV
jgi:hypothetical protein